MSSDDTPTRFGVSYIASQVDIKLPQNAFSRALCYKSKPNRDIVVKIFYILIKSIFEKSSVLIFKLKMEWGQFYLNNTLIVVTDSAAHNQPYFF